MELQERAGDLIDSQRGGIGHRPTAVKGVRADSAVDLAHVAVVEHLGAGGGEIGKESRQELAEELRSAAEQTVQVSALGRAAAVNRFVGQSISFDNRHCRVVVSEDRGGSQAGDSGPQHDCVISHVAPRLQTYVAN
ncbi:hypothetical protein GCM10009856_54540 [Mycolicibacterium llatzerense]